MACGSLSLVECAFGLSWASAGIAPSWPCPGLSWYTDSPAAWILLGMLARWSRHAPVGAVASSCLVAFVRPGLLEPLLCYLNVSLAGDSFPPKQRLCVPQVSALCL